MFSFFFKLNSFGLYWWQKLDWIFQFPRLSSIAFFTVVPSLSFLHFAWTWLKINWNTKWKCSSSLLGTSASVSWKSAFPLCLSSLHIENGDKNAFISISGRNTALPLCSCKSLISPHPNAQQRCRNPFLNPSGLWNQQRDNICELSWSFTNPCQKHQQKTT